VTALRASALAAVLTVAGCATTAAPSAPRAGATTPRTPYVLRCSPDDPDRGAWYCAVGRVLYAVLGMMQPEVGLIRP
jgi:hypothetical protein